MRLYSHFHQNIFLDALICISSQQEDNKKTAISLAKTSLDNDIKEKNESSLITVKLEPQ